MKTTTFLMALCLLANSTLFSQTTNNLQLPTSVNADGAAPDASAVLDVQSTTQGMLTPRLTTAQRTAIATPATGLLVYDTDTGSFWFFGDNTWNEILTAMPPAQGGAIAPATPIPACNPAGISSVINLTGTDTIAADSRFRVCLDITHPRTGDLSISLTAPDGTVIDLSSDNGGFERNYTGTCFTTEATSPITGGSAPFSGIWQPEETFSAFTGKAIAGNWVLNVVDDQCLGTGQLESWSLNISRPSAVATLLADADGDTRVSVEDLPDEDIVRLESGGTARLEIRPDCAVFTGLLRLKDRFVSGNSNNTASGVNSFVGGGGSSFFNGGNTASGTSSFVGGGGDNTASGGSSFVGGGGNNTASGQSSFVGGGGNNTASGQSSFVSGGGQNTASGSVSFVGGGSFNTASGSGSFVGGGTKLTAESYSETVFGTYNTDYTPFSTSSFNVADRLFVIGNGTSTSNRSNAVTVLKNGNVGIGTSTPSSNLEIKTSTSEYGANGGLRIERANSDHWNINSYSTVHTDLGFFYNGASKGWLDSSSDVGQIDFTAQHRSLPAEGTVENYTDKVGMIVSSAGNIYNLDGSNLPTVNESIPTVELSDRANDKRVYGVVSGIEKPEKDGEHSQRKYLLGTFGTSIDRVDENDYRLIINSGGEGALWVSNFNGTVENGDLITTSLIPGIGMKQEDDLIHNYTAAKVVMDCDFDLDSDKYNCKEVTHNGKTYRIAFLACVYKCN